MKSKLWIIAAVGCLVPLSFIAAPYPDELVLQHIPTICGLAILAAVVVRTHVSNLSFACVLAFVLLHILGARWIYSYVPYDAWVKQLTGVSLAERFGWRRNHYDRFVHLAFGLLAVAPTSELLQRTCAIRPRVAASLAVVCTLAIGAVYEIMEWQISLFCTADMVEAYNGQQGDAWDPQKDMALAWLGATIAAVLLSNWRPDKANGK